MYTLFVYFSETLIICKRKGILYSVNADHAVLNHKDEFIAELMSIEVLSELCCIIATQQMLEMEKIW